MATNNPDKVQERHRRRLLGMCELDNRSINVNDLYPAGTFPLHLQDGKGGHIWPHAVPILKAWKFDPAPIINEILDRNFAQSARNSFETLPSTDTDLILQCPHVEVEVAELPVELHTEKLLSDKLRRDRQIKAVRLDRETGQPGPVPSSWSALVSHSDGPTSVYLAQFGKNPVWKIGISQNPQDRMRALNFSIPKQFTGCDWELRMKTTCPNGRSAYNVERSFLVAVKDLHPVNEQFVCDSKRAFATWNTLVLSNLED